MIPCILGKDMYCHQSNDIPRSPWTPEMDRYFIDLLLERVYNGDKIDCVSNSQVWTDLYASFSNNFALEHGKESLKSRHKSLEIVFNCLKNLLSQKGFSWDETQQMVTADADVWDAYIKVQFSSGRRFYISFYCKRVLTYYSCRSIQMQNHIEINQHRTIMICS